MKKEYIARLKVAIAGFVQIYVSSYALFRIVLYEIRCVIHAAEVKQNHLVAFIIGSYFIYMLYFAIRLLKFNNYARIISISNMFGLAVISLASFLFVDSITPHLLIFCISLFFVSVYFIYFLTRPRIKGLF